MSILPSDTPRLPKWPFLLGDAVLLGFAGLLAKYSPQPYANPVIIAIAGCVALAAILGVVPFLTDYAGKQDEALDERQRGLEALTRTVADSAEQISVAAASLHELTDVARKQLAQAENLPLAVDEGIQGFKVELAKTMAEAGESLRQEIKTLRTAESGKLDGTLQNIQEALAELKKRVTAEPTPLAAVKPRTTPETPIDSGIESKPDEAHATITAPTVVDPVATPAENSRPPADLAAPREVAEVTPKPSKKSPLPKKTKVPEPAELPPVPPADAAGEFSLSADDSPSAVAATRAGSVASDGVTSLYVTAYIGIGNRLFIRGDGAGLSADKGVPLQFVSIGKWQWETKDATEALHVRLYKNDEIECLSPGELLLEPGHQVEVSASF